jgi:hypothetical protein
MRLPSVSSSRLSGTRFPANALNDKSLIKVNRKKWRFASDLQINEKNSGESPLLPLLSAHEPVIPNEVRNLLFMLAII